MRVAHHKTYLRKLKRHQKQKKWLGQIFGLIILVTAFYVYQLLTPTTEHLPAWQDKKNKVLDKKEEEIHHMEIHCLDQKDRPMSIKSEKTLEVPHKDLVLYQLFKIQGFVEVKPSQRLSIESEAGMLDKVNQNLTLQTGVKIQHPAGYTLITEEVFWNTYTHDASGEQDVEGWSAQSLWKGSGFSYEDKSGILQVHGPATLDVEPS